MEKPSINENKNIWANIWSSKRIYEEFEYWHRRDMHSIRTKKILGYLQKYFREIRGLKCVEVGSGMGVYSLIMAKMGAGVTLLDNCEIALEKAEEMFSREGIKGSFIVSDILSLDKSMLSTFDIAMSFGLVEHFWGSGRLEAARAHYDLVRPGGAVIISVPNILFLPHEILKRYLISRNKWGLGYEGSFTRRELFSLADKLGLKKIRVFGSSFLADIKHYMEVYANTRLLNKVIPYARNYKVENFTEKASIFDDIFGADIVLLGIK